jgi:tetratricopeptide (TPR) repeat protein
MFVPLKMAGRDTRNRDPKARKKPQADSSSPPERSSSAPRPGPTPSHSSRRTAVLIGAALFALVIAVFLPTAHNGFVAFDDNEYVYENAHVREGLTWEGVRWAFTTLEVGGLWHPLTWLSLMLDCHWHGLNPGGHHLGSLVLHAFNTVLLFAALRRLTGATWRSAVVAALFAVHPLHVETVAWIADRKDTLSALFWMLTLLAYARYVGKAEGAGGERPAAAGLRPLASGDYWLALFFFVCGLMSKPTVMTLPVILLMLDAWPLRRLETGGATPLRARVRVLIWEKLPFLAAGFVCAIIGIQGQSAGGMLQTTIQFPFEQRLANATISYLHYLAQTVWPANLAAYYPYPKSFPVVRVFGAGLFLLGVSLAVWRTFRSRPYLALGWGWYLVALFPMIGLVQIGSYARADRYTYLPLIGIFLTMVWGAQELTRHRRHQRLISTLLAGAVLLACAVVSRRQLAFWRDSETLFRHAIESTTGNFAAHNNLGNALDRAGRFAEAGEQYRAALRIHPGFAAAHYNRANLLTREGDLPGALTHYNAAVQAKPDYAQARYNLGITLNRLGKPVEAIAQYREAVRLNPGFVEAHHSLGGALVQQGRVDEGLESLIIAVRLRPGFAHARNDLGVALALRGNDAAAETNFAELVRLEPLNADAHYNLANSLSAQGKLQAAAAEYSETLRLNPQDRNAREKLQKLQGAPPATPP